jgi:hypothetical protein
VKAAIERKANEEKKKVNYELSFKEKVSNMFKFMNESAPKSLVH